MRIYTLDEVAAHLQVCRRTVYSLIQHHAFPKPIKVGRLSRWHQHEVHAWVRQQRAAA